MNDEPIYPIDAEYTHVFPLNDLQEHVLVGKECPCHPRVELHGAELIVIHNSFDHREIAERRFENYRWN